MHYYYYCYKLHSVHSSLQVLLSTNKNLLYLACSFPQTKTGLKKPLQTLRTSVCRILRCFVLVISLHPLMYFTDLIIGINNTFHRMIEWFGLERNLEITQSQRCCHRQGHLPLAQLAQGPIQPGSEHFQRLGIHSFSG